VGCERLIRTIGDRMETQAVLPIQRGDDAIICITHCNPNRWIQPMPTITLLFASLHAFLLLVLLARISRHRHQHRIGVGDGGDVLLARKIRVHGNFIENVPFALLLLALLELGGLAHVWLWLFGAALLLGRVLHAVGFSRSGGESFGRFYGTALTWSALLAMALAGLWLWLAH